MAKRRNFTDQFKAKVALEALRGDKTVQEIAAKHQLHPNQVSTWKRQAIEGMADVFSGGNPVNPLSRQISQCIAIVGCGQSLGLEPPHLTRRRRLGFNG